MTEKISILLAEDEPALGQIVKESLETRDFIVHLAEDGEKALKLYREHNPQLLVLDVMLPKKDGFTLAREIRKQGDTIPIIFLTSKSQPADVVEGFGAGGNDYLKKPFSMEELIVRIHNLLQRSASEQSAEVLTFGDFTLNLTKQTLQFREEDPELLTHREAHLLFHLVKNKNQLLDRSLILNKLWGNDDFFNARSMDVFISKLRKKLSRDERIQILSVRGFGYKLIC